MKKKKLKEAQREILEHAKRDSNGLQDKINAFTPPADQYTAYYEYQAYADAPPVDVILLKELADKALQELVDNKARYVEYVLMVSEHQDKYSEIMFVTNSMQEMYKDKLEHDQGKGGRKGKEYEKYESDIIIPTIKKYQRSARNDNFTQEKAIEEISRLIYEKNGVNLLPSRQAFKAWMSMYDQNGTSIY